MNNNQRYLYERYLRSNEYSLGDAYTRYSAKKRDAWDRCRALCFKKHGTGLRIVSHNGYMFTAGFLFVEDGKKKMMYITKYREEEFEVD